MKRTALLLCGLLFCLMGYSQEEWDLKRCITQAIENNLNVKQGTLAVQSADANLRQSKLAVLPSLNGSASGGLGFGRVTTADNITTSAPVSFSNNFSLNAGLTLFNGMQIRNNIELSRLNKEISSLDQRALEENIIIEISGAYLQVLLAKEQLNIAKTQLELSEASLENSVKLARAGVIPDGDLRSIEAQVANDELTIINEQNNFDLALLTLKLAMQVDPNLEMDVAVPPESLLASVIDQDNWNADEIYSYASRNLSTYISNDLSMQGADKQIDVARGALYPSLSIGGGLSSLWFRTSDEFAFVPPVGDPIPWNPYRTQLSDNFAQSVGLSLNVPIFNNGIAKRNVELAGIDFMRQQYSNEIELNTLRRDITQAIANAESWKKSYEALTRLVEARRLEFEFAESRFNAGQSNSFEYNNTRDQLTLAEVQLVQSKYQYIFAVKVLDFYQGKPVTF